MVKRGESWTVGILLKSKRDGEIFQNIRQKLC